MLTIDTIPLNLVNSLEWKVESEDKNPLTFHYQLSTINYLFSLCTRWQRQRRQNFLSSSLFGVFFLFFVVT